MKSENEIKRKKVLAIIFIVMVISIIGIIVVKYALKVDLFTNAARYEQAETLTTADGNFQYEVLDDGTIKITYYAGTDTEVTIPKTIEEKPVTVIGTYAFYYDHDLTKLTIPEGVTTIENADAFYFCFNLAAIKVDSNNQNFISEDGVLFNKDKTRIICYPATKEGTEYIIPEEVTVIGANAFQHSRELEKITIPTGVESIEYDAFAKCSRLLDITIPEGVTSIGNYAFWECSSLTEITIPEGVTSIGDGAFSSCSSLTEITIPEGVTSIGEYAFSTCSSLTKITIPEGVTSIEEYAFSSCSSLTEITIPEGVTSIGDYAFSSCSSLTSIIIPEGVTSIGNRVFDFCKSLTEITIPEGVTSIGDSAFGYCTSLESITIPNSVTSIGNRVFDFCKSLTEITIPEGVTSIGDSAFGYCTSLESITIPNSVTSIGNWAFHKCSSLTEITIPEGVTSIGTEVFSGCVNLTIYGTSDSAAETYANNNNIQFVDITNDALITAETITEEDYGRYVTNYVASNASNSQLGIGGWRIFHSDGENIYLIADDYVNPSYVPKGKNNTEVVTSTEYSKGFSLAPAADYEGWSDISNTSIASKWLSQYVASGYSSTDYPMKATAYLLDTNQWSGFANSSYAEYAIGGPTLELFVASYNATHETNIDTQVNGAGAYMMKWSTSSSYSTGISGLDISESLYVINSNTNAMGMWVASPVLGSLGPIGTMDYNGWLSYLTPSGTRDGARPIIALKSNVELKKQTDGNYVIVEDTYEFDNQSPTITVNPTSTEATARLDITITAAEIGGSGFSQSNEYQYQLGTSREEVPTGTWNTYQSGSTNTFGEGLEGQYYLWVKGISDAAGNTSISNGTLKTIDGTNYHVYGPYIFGNLDKTPPTITIDELITAETITAEDYGGYVTNYMASNASNSELGIGGWRIFHSDGENIYLIADDYINTSYAPNGKGGTAVVANTDYSKGFSLDPYVDYVGWSDISNSDVAKKWLSQYATLEYASEYINMKGTAYLLDENIWAGYKDSSGYAEYAIGGATIELFAKAYNATHEIDIETQVTQNGYTLKLAGSFGPSISGIEDTLESLYVITSTENAEGMWIASPSSYNSKDQVLLITNYCATNAMWPNVSKFGARPIIALKSNVELEKKEDGTYLIVEDTEKEQTWEKSHNVKVTITDTESGLAQGANLQYGWSTSKTTEPTQWTDAVVSRYEEGAFAASFKATGSGIVGKNYLWIKPIELKDMAGNIQTQSKISDNMYCFRERVGIEVSNVKTTYEAGERFDTTGMTVSIVYNTGEKEETTEYTISNNEALTCEVKKIEIQSKENPEIKTEVQINVGHTEVIDASQEPTCTETGLTEGKHCSVCNTVLEQQEIIPAKGHTEVIDASQEPTCTETGLTEGKHCSECNIVLVEQEEIAALGHNYENGICTNCEIEKTLEIASNKYKVDSLYIARVQPGTTVEAYKNNMKTNATEINIYDENNKKLSDADIVATGMKVEFKLGTQTQTLKMSVIGDVDGNGKVNFQDMVVINKIRLRKKILQGEYLLAADVKEDNKVDFQDMVKINKFRLKKISQFF